MILTRRVAALAAVPVLLAVAAPPASADPGAVAFTGTAHIDCWGCASSPGTADLTVIGATNAVIAGSAHATFTAFAGPGSCLISGSARGTVTGAISVDFTWTRVGATGVMTTSGDINGAGTAVFVVVSPIGVACSGPVDALLAGDIAGA